MKVKRKKKRTPKLFFKYKKRAKRKLGIWEGIASFKIMPGFKMTVDEFLES